jgi:lipoate-protein ligase A
MRTHSRICCLRWVEIGAFRGFQILNPVYQGRVIFDQLQLWIDPVKRPGPEAMAVDEWLLEVAEVPVLRVYGWLGDWGSIGYFGALAAAMAAFPGIDWVRRWTGGGTVDHRADWTYTVVVPAGRGLASARGAESYRWIHGVLAEALREEGIDAKLSTGADETGASLCFENPVNHDLVGSRGEKLAGAGQRRTRSGLLHQGSVAAECDAESSVIRAGRLASRLSKYWETCDLQPPDDIIVRKVGERYAHPAWTGRR